MTADTRRCRHNYAAYCQDIDTSPIRLIGPFPSVKATEDWALQHRLQVVDLLHHPRPRWVVLVLGYHHAPIADMDVIEPADWHLVAAFDYLLSSVQEVATARDGLSGHRPLISLEALLPARGQPPCPGQQEPLADDLAGTEDFARASLRMVRAPK